MYLSRFPGAGGALPGSEGPGEAGQVAGNPAGTRARQWPATHHSSHSHAQRKDRATSPVSPVPAGAERVRAGAHHLRWLLVVRDRDALSIPASVVGIGARSSLLLPFPRLRKGQGASAQRSFHFPLFLRTWSQFPSLLTFPGCGVTRAMCQMLFSFPRLWKNLVQVPPSLAATSLVLGANRGSLSNQASPALGVLRVCAFRCPRLTACG